MDTHYGGVLGSVVGSFVALSVCWGCDWGLPLNWRRRVALWLLGRCAAVASWWPFPLSSLPLHPCNNYQHVFGTSIGTCTSRKHEHIFRRCKRTTGLWLGALSGRSRAFWHFKSLNNNYYYFDSIHIVYFWLILLYHIYFP